MRDVIGLEIGDGTAQIMKSLVAREIIGKDARPYLMLSACVQRQHFVSRFRSRRCYARMMLSPYRVLDLTNERGLLCGQILGDLGADVIKVEPPGGSSARKIGPFFQDQPDPNRSLYWWAYNRNKRSITLDVDAREGREILFRLAKDAHFLIESDSPGHLASLGLGYQDLAAKNPALIGVSITPFGQDGPKASYADSDLVILAAGGPLVLTGDDDRAPVRVSVPQGYLHACADAAVGALAAHHERCFSGLGQHVDVSAQQSLAIATQSGILAAPLDADQYRRAAGGVKSGTVDRATAVAREGRMDLVHVPVRHGARRIHRQADALPGGAGMVRRGDGATRTGSDSARRSRAARSRCPNTIARATSCRHSPRATPRPNCCASRLRRVFCSRRSRPSRTWSRARNFARATISRKSSIRNSGARFDIRGRS